MIKRDAGIVAINESPAVELVVPARPDGMAEVVPLQPRQRRARFVGGAGSPASPAAIHALAILGLRPARRLCRLDLACAVPSVARQRWLHRDRQRRRQHSGAKNGRSGNRDAFKPFRPDPSAGWPGSTLTADRDHRLENISEHLLCLS